MSEMNLKSGVAADIGDEKNELPGKPRLIDLTERERWSVPAPLSAPLFARLEEIVTDPTADRREVLAAASAMIAASKLNLANLELTIKVREVEELEVRLDELERQLAIREGGATWAT